MNEKRFIVELEGNHHYILVDTITGYSYYCPAQEDANTIASLLNNLQNLVENQRVHIEELTEKLKGFGVSDTNPVEYCYKCKYGIVETINNDESYYCEFHEKGVGKYDSCRQFTL